MSAEKKEHIPTVGYVQPTFPRDPVDINQFLEHMFVGQVIEPLVDSDKFGQVVGGIGKAWSFEKDGKQIRFQLDLTRKFSNGTPVQASDVVYSISRHLGTHSQSAQFLADIEAIEGVGKDQVLVRLKRINPGIIKALTRDQLGIVPKDWMFHAGSTEPYIGTGPYKLVKKENDWYFEANPNYREPGLVKIKKWKVKFLTGEMNGIPEGDIADFVPSITELSLNKIKARPNYRAADFVEKKNISYTQTSFWVFPTSPYFKNAESRLHLARLFDAASEAYAKENQLTRATGLIPLGISGHNAVKPALPAAKGKLEKELRIAYLRGGFESFLQSEAFKKETEKAGLHVELIPFDPPKLYELKGKKLDIITGSWAGGYSDPTGFLGLLTPMLGMGFDTYLGEMAPLLHKASGESDWNLRAAEFKKFDAALVKSGLLTPGWQIPTYSLTRKPLRYNETQSRYSERFINVVE